MKIAMEMRQTTSLSPQMRQAVQILQMGSQELEEYALRLAAENPLIEVTTFADRLSRRNRNDTGMHFPDVEAMAAPGEESLHDVLMSQLNLLTLSKREYRTARYLIGCLDGNGYLEIAPEEAAKALGTDTDSVLRALRLVQSLEPAGVGAADLQECLLLQLEHREQMTPLLKELIERHFEQLCKQRFDAISKRLGVPKRAIVEAYRVLRSLNPRPGGGFESGQKTVYIVPDVLVAAKDGGFDIKLNDAVCPEIAIQPSYRNLLEQNLDDGTRQYMARKLEQARWTMSCIAARRRTLFRVTEAIVEWQEAFFRKGPKHMAPMVLKDIAGRLGLHESTVSRATKHKYVRCDWGTYELKRLFAPSLNRSASLRLGGDAAKRMIRDIIDRENKNKTWSDREIAELLLSEGIRISRRTVAKYRESMNIASAADRKQRLI